MNEAESALAKLEEEWAFVPQVWADSELAKDLQRLEQLSSDFDKQARYRNSASRATVEGQWARGE